MALASKHSYTNKFSILFGKLHKIGGPPPPKKNKKIEKSELSEMARTLIDFFLNFPPQKIFRNFWEFFKKKSEFIFGAGQHLLEV